MANGKKVLVSVSQLKLGMFVCELDRPWLETPFIFQGFRVMGVEDVEKLRKVCEYVHVDVEKSISISSAQGAASAPPPSTLPPRGRIYRIENALEEEIQHASEIRVASRHTVDHVFDDVAHGRKIDVYGVKRVVNDMVDGILRNPNAHLCLTHLKKRDEYTAQHSINVSVLALAFGRHLGLSRDQLNMLGVGALLHDVGKIKTPTDILNKPDRLTEEEFAIMRSHPVHGRKILEQFADLPYDVVDMAFGHHERFAGTGYPRGLTNEQMSLWSKLVAIVDVYDAITSDRCYHKGMSPTEALTKMYSWRLRDFDPELIEQFIQCVGIYPVGTLVELTGGEVGVVISVNEEERLRPKVSLILNADKHPYYPSRVVDLAITGRSDSGADYGIKQVLPPGSFNIDAKDEIAQIGQAQLKTRPVAAESGS